MPISRIALVGHCGFDSGSLARFASDAAPDAEVIRINDQQALNESSGVSTLLLVNRVLDGRFDVGRSGIELIKTIAELPDAGPMMLVSNYADAQEEAEAMGALPGFGKSEMADATTRQRIANAIAKA
ncbi:MAG: hypothetical protein AAF085_11885 [Planctomycetota bacterium]